MRRTILSAFLLFSFIAYSHASTSVSSLTSSAQWNAAGSPYLIQDKVVVPKGATLQVGPGVQVNFQGNGELEIQGELDSSPKAAFPAVFNMEGLKNRIVINDGDAHIVNTKFIGGTFQVKSGRLNLKASEFTKGKGLYLGGSSFATVVANKFYGNEAGVVLDGARVNAIFEYNIFAENTYGLDLRKYYKFKFHNNIVRDSTKAEVVVRSKKMAFLGGN